MPTKRYIAVAKRNVDMDELTADYPDLVLVYQRTGVPWRWAGTARIRTKRGERVRVERWFAPCRACGDDFEVLAKLPKRHGAAYLTRYARPREPGQLPDVRIVVPRYERSRGFELRNCKPCREALRLV